MIKDIHEFLTEVLSIDATNIYDEDVVNKVQLFNGMLGHELAKRLNCQDSDININIINRNMASATNMLLYVTITGVDDVATRSNVSDQIYSIIRTNIGDYPELQQHNYTKKNSYSSSVKVNELLYKDETHKIKLNYVVKNMNAGISLKSIRNSDITEIMPVLLFYKFAYSCDSVPEAPTIDFIRRIRDTLFELKKNKSKLIPQDYHLDRYTELFDNVEFDDLAMSKIRAGIRLYKFLVEHFGHELVSISIVANETGYDTVADLNCTLTNDRIVPVSVKSYSSLCDALKIKSVAWHRLIYNNTYKNVKCTLPEEFAITNNQDEIQASLKLLQRLSNNLESHWHTKDSDVTTLDILIRCILSKQENTMVVDTLVRKSVGVIYYEEISPKYVNAQSFAGCKMVGNTLEVNFGNNMKFNIVVRFKNRYPTFDIYYPRKNENVQ